jgi:hypothetical protein
MRTATSRSSGLSAGTFVEIKTLYLAGVLHLKPRDFRVRGVLSGGGSEEVKLARV